MRTEQVRIYKFDELPEGAKDTARAWFREGNDYVWWEDSLKSIKAFCAEYGVTIKDYQVGLCSYSYMETNAENNHFRGRKLSKVKRDYMPTGYCLDCNLWETFHDVWKETGSPLRAFNDAIDKAVKSILSDMEYQDSDEAVDEMLIANEYEFTEDGKFY